MKDLVASLSIEETGRVIRIVEGGLVRYSLFIFPMGYHFGFYKFLYRSWTAQTERLGPVTYFTHEPVSIRHILVDLLTDRDHRTLVGLFELDERK